MRHNRISFLLIVLFLPACNFQQKELYEKEKQSIKTTLEKLAIENLKDWEPPFNEKKFLQHFTQNNDFSFAVDGFHVNNYDDWVSIVYESMDYDRKNYKEYRDVITEIEALVINPEYGLVTVDYVWDYITVDDLHYNVKSMVTMLFRKEDDNWKVVNTHCSHGESQIMN